MSKAKETISRQTYSSAKLIHSSPNLKGKHSTSGANFARFTKAFHLTRVKMKEKLLRTAREKSQVTYKEKPIRLRVDLSVETLHARRDWGTIVKILK